jgi:ParB/RepB/Spo0J family partition protein
MTSPHRTPAHPAGVQHIQIDYIRPNPFQPRSQRDDEEAQRADEALREDMRLYGFRGAIQVRRDPANPQGPFQLVAGHRRLAAWRSLGNQVIPAQVVEHDREMRLAAVTENLVREDLSPWDEAVALGELRREGFGMRELGRRLGKSPGWVASRLRLLNLEDEALREVARSEPEMLTALSLLALFDPADQEVLFRMVRAGEYDTLDLKALLSVRKERLRQQDAAVTEEGTTRHEVPLPPASPPREAGAAAPRGRVAHDERLLEAVRRTRRERLPDLAREMTRALETAPAVEQPVVRGPESPESVVAQAPSRPRSTALVRRTPRSSARLVGS